jgi:hypothetical protein
VFLAHARISRRRFLASGHVQVGLGIPLARGALLAEPVVRFELTAGDDSAHWRHGVELTARLF